MIKHYYVGAENIMIDTEMFVHKKIQDFMRFSKNYDFSPIFSYTIKFIENKEAFYGVIKSIINQKKSCKFFKLKNITYIYDTSANIYFVIKSSFLAIIILNKKKSLCFFNEKNINGRNLFHTCILDALSLSLPSSNKIVFHGAAIKEKDMTILLLGRSGNGKSTLSYKIINKQPTACKLCDDTFILENGTTPQIYPLITGEGYSPEIANHLISKQNYKLLFHDEYKYKTYVMKEQNDYSPHPASIIIFLVRTQEDKKEISTHIHKCSPQEIFLNIIDSQTNIASPFLSKKINCYKDISQKLKGYIVTYNYDCDEEQLIRTVLLNE